MYIRIQFENIDSEETKATQSLIGGSPSGMCLSSMNSHPIRSKEMNDAVGYSVWFWHLDVDVLNKHYGGAFHSLCNLLEYPGVSRVDILPIEGRYNDKNWDELLENIKPYFHGVNNTAPKPNSEQISN